MKTNQMFIGLAMLIVVALVVGVFYVLAQNNPVGPVACTTEAKICPDGSSVGRTGPNCEFAACPAVSTTVEQESVVAALNQRILKSGVHITPLSVVEDSRCPVDVQCIQAGTVRIKAQLENGTSTQVVTMETGSPISFGNKHVTLMRVTPSKSSKTTIAPADYIFTFSVAFGMGGDTTN